VALVTWFAVTAKVTPLAPAGTVTMAGTVAAELSAEIVTTTPPTGAGARSESAPCAEPPLATLAGTTEKVS